MTRCERCGTPTRHGEACRLCERYAFTAAAEPPPPLLERVDPRTAPLGTLPAAYGEVARRNRRRQQTD